MKNKINDHKKLFHLNFCMLAIFCALHYYYKLKHMSALYDFKVMDDLVIK